MITASYPTELQMRRLRKAVREYEAKGYEVSLLPGHEEAPDFLDGYQPHAIAYGEEETVIIEATSMTSLVSASHLPVIARRIQEYLGWRYELIVSNPKQPTLGEGYESEMHLNKRDMYVRMKEAQELLKEFHQEAALLLMWSVIAAALVSLAVRERVPVQRKDPPYLLKQLVFLTYISRDDYWILRLALKLQEVISNGIQTDELEDNWLQEIFQATMRLIQS